MAQLPGKSGAAANRKRLDDRYRGSAASRGYGSTWQKDRAVWIQRNPICCDPYARHVGQRRPTNVRDHKVRRVLGGPDSDENYQPLCFECDGYKRHLESRGLAGTWETER